MSDTKITGPELERMTRALPEAMLWHDCLDPYLLREILSAMGYYDMLEALQVIVGDVERSPRLFTGQEKVAIARSAIKKATAEA